MKLYIIRHGQTIENKVGITQGQNEGSLSAEGILQVEKLAKRLKDDQIDIIYSSDLGRAWQTTQIIAQYHPDIPIIYDKRLREGYKGPFEGTTHADQERIFGPEMKYGTETRQKILQNHPEVEKYDQIYARASECFDEIRKNNPEKSVLISAHETIDIALIYYLENRSQENMFEEMKKMSLANASLTMYEIKPDGVKKIIYDDVSHL